MNEVNVYFMSDQATETLSSNTDYVTKMLTTECYNYEWLEAFCENPFVKKNYRFVDFELKLGVESYAEVEVENAIILYEHLKHLPRYILTDERFWLWLNFKKGYQVAQQVMPISSASTFQNHWLMRSKRRGIFFGFLSRYFFYAELTAQENLPDKYRLTRFIIENKAIFREFTWRNYSSQKHLFRGIIQGCMKAMEEYHIPSRTLKLMAREISKLGSVQLLDVISESEIAELVYKEVQRLHNLEISLQQQR